MPEGPSIIIAKEAIISFKGKKVLKAGGSTKLDVSILNGKTITDIKSWGKHLLISFKDVTVRIHFLMFGSYTMNAEKKNRYVKLKLEFQKGSINFYACNIKFIEDNLDDVYDWKADVMGDTWSAVKAKNKLKKNMEELICDALLDQNIFSGVGNIIKNEALFLARIHPESNVKDIPPLKMNELIKEARNYSFDFLKWKQENTLKKHWLAYTKKICPRDKVPFIKKYCGKTKRRTFYCELCMIKYGDEKPPVTKPVKQRKAQNSKQ